jgi:hypothetical protein
MVCNSCLTKLDLLKAGIGSWSKVKEEHKVNFGTVLSCTTVSFNLEKDHNQVRRLWKTVVLHSWKDY